MYYESSAVYYGSSETVNSVISALQSYGVNGVTYGSFSYKGAVTYYLDTSGFTPSDEFDWGDLSGCLAALDYGTLTYSFQTTGGSI